MKLPLIFLAATLWVASTCHAQNVVGCTDGSGMTYQAPPCPAGTTTMPTSIAMTAPSAVAESRTDVVPAAAAPLPRASLGRKAIQSSRDELQVGMSDLQVLNNRRWGKPQKITRNRQDRVWHERWRYETGANGGKQLHFINGMLASIEELTQSLRTATDLSAP